MMIKRLHESPCKAAGKHFLTPPLTDQGHFPAATIRLLPAFLLPAFLLVVFLLTVTKVSAQDPAAVATDNRLSSPMDSLIQDAVLQFMKDSSRVGLSVGIVAGDETYTYNYGSTERGAKTLPGSRTIYEIGSISKTFTGLLLARAILDQKISLQDDIRKYLAEAYPNLEYKGRPVKIVHLANHTSGLPPFLPDRPDIFQETADSIPFLLSDLHKNYTKAQFLNDLHTVRIDTVPGINYRYSNVAAQLIGFILERVYNKSFQALIDEYISTPLAMGQTRASFPADTADMAAGYDRKGTRMPYMPVLMKPSGGIYSSAPDMLKYLRFQLDETQDAVRLSHAPTQRYSDSSGIGLYWRLNKVSGNIRKIWHTGGTFGFSSYCVVYPDINTGMVLLSNEFDPGSQGALIAIAERVLEKLIQDSAGM